MRAGSGAMDTRVNRLALPDMLKQRIITAVIALAILLLALFVLPEPATRLIIAFLMLMAAWEWSGFLRLSGWVPRLAYVSLIALTGALLWFAGDAGTISVAMQVAIAWWLAAFVWILLYPTPIPAPLAWVAGALVIIPAWMALDWLYSTHAMLLLFVLGLVWAADIGAYFAGKRFGRVKLAPSVSPGKSWEGVVGGMLAVVILACAVGWLASLDLEALLPLSLAVATISIVGDLTVSMFKRNAGLKDSGKLFPGHGGVLDRIDSVSAAAPIFVFGAGWAGLR